MSRKKPLPPALVDLLEQQDGVVARWQVIASGPPRHVIRSRLSTGEWRAIYPGVYATFTGTLDRRAMLWAAVLYCSWHGRRPKGQPHMEPDAVLSHETAAELHGLIENHDSLIHVTVPATKKMPRKAPGLRVHASIRLAEAKHPAKSPPCIRPVPTVIDLTQTARTTDDAITWLSRACGKRLATPAQLLEAINTRKKLRRRAELLHALGDTAEGSHSVLEIRYHRNVERSHGLPTGVRQRRRVMGVRREYDDVVYKNVDVVVELDGLTGHERGQIPRHAAR